MMRYLGAFAMAAPLLVAVVAEPASAQKTGGILKMSSPDSPASMSIHEEATFVAEGPMMGVFKPFMAKDVQCTFDMLTGKSSEKLRVNPRKSWWRNLEAVTTNGDYEVTFHLKRPQPAFLTALAGGYSPIYPCHIKPRDMRQRPIGTGPFKFVEFKPNERITVTRNPDYWKAGRPYLDGIEYT